MEYELGNVEETQLELELQLVIVEEKVSKIIKEVEMCVKQVQEMMRDLVQEWVCVYLLEMNEKVLEMMVFQALMKMEVPQEM